MVNKIRLNKTRRLPKGQRIHARRVKQAARNEPINPAVKK